jgi:hypothetical protein
MKSSDILFAGAPLGTVRIQVLSMDQTANVLDLLNFFKVVGSLSRSQRLRYWSMGSWHALSGSLHARKALDGGFNEIEWKAQFDKTMQVAAALSLDSAIGTLVLSPTNRLWGATEGYLGKPQDGLRLTFDSRREGVRNSGIDDYPTLLDLLIYRSAHRSPSDSLQFFDLMMQAVRSCNLTLIQYACGDLNTRSDNLLTKGQSLLRPPKIVGELLDGFHAMLLVKSSLYKTLTSSLPAEYMMKKESLSSDLGAMLFSDDVLSEFAKRQRVLRAQKPLSG